MRKLFFISIILIGWGGTSALSDPVAWVDRCLQTAGANKENGFQHQDLTSETCTTTILNYCNFAAEAGACFGDLTKTFRVRTDNLLVLLPPVIDAPKVQQTLYQRRLGAISNLPTIIPCQEGQTPESCAAQVALTQYLFARSSLDWVAKYEDKK